MSQQELIPHLFRTEFQKITVVLCKLFGLEHMQLAEDIASETFLAAMESWPYKGVPENPVAWLYAVAKNKAKNYLQRQHVFTEKIAPVLKTNELVEEEIRVDLSEENIKDSQLQMLFAVCHGAISVEAQIALALRILCGFGIDEIANAFLTSKEVINKRLYRAKEKLREENVQIKIPSPDETAERLQTVLTTLYLLFNEGYFSESNDNVLREDICIEAMRLNRLLIENESTNLPEANALLSLMCFHASRFKARTNERGEMILYDDQDESLWDKELIEKGVYYLHCASKGNQLSKYHLEAGIAYWHTIKTDSKEKWENILQLYNHLLQLAYSPVAALNRTYALSKARSKAVAIEQAEKLQLTNNHYYYSLLGELYAGIDNDKALMNLEKALSMAKTKTDKEVIRRRMESVRGEL